MPSKSDDARIPDTPQIHLSQIQHRSNALNLSTAKDPILNPIDDICRVQSGALCDCSCGIYSSEQFS